MTPESPPGYEYPCFPNAAPSISPIVRHWLSMKPGDKTAFPEFEAGFIVCSVNVSQRTSGAAKEQAGKITFNPRWLRLVHRRYRGFMTNMPDGTAGRNRRLIPVASEETPAAVVKLIENRLRLLDPRTFEEGGSIGSLDTENAFLDVFGQITQGPNWTASRIEPARFTIAMMKPPGGSKTQWIADLTGDAPGSWQERVHLLYEQLDSGKRDDIDGAVRKLTALDLQLNDQGVYREPANPQGPEL